MRTFCRWFVFVLAALSLQSGIQFAEAKGKSHEVSLDRFQSSIDQFAKHDLDRMPAAGGTVFVGSSSFAHWRALEEDFKAFNAINRGFGGSTVPEVNHYFARLVTKYKPAKVVLYAGTNDIADGHSAGRVAQDVATFVHKAHEQIPDAQVYFISMSVAPCRFEWDKEYLEGNRLIERMTAGDSKFHFIDVTKVMRDAKDELRGDYFGPDRLHMNRQGYEAWIPIIRKALSSPQSVK